MEFQLVDQHCHGVIAGDLDTVAFDGWLTEAAAAASPTPGRDPFESMLGLAVRRWCAPVLDLPALATKNEYLERRAELGWREVTERLLRAAGVATWLVDTGFVPNPSDSTALGVGDEREVVRIEQVAETLAAQGDFWLEEFREQLRRRAANAVGLKTIIGYRCGLALPETRPSDDDARRAGERWLRSGEPRLGEPELLWWLVHEAATVAAELGLPLQVHTGFGDPDLRLRDVDPALLHGFIDANPTVTVVLLHCWPYHRNAAYLAHVFPNVTVDIGLTLPFVGDRAGAILAEVLELAPFQSVVYSSDGRALPETHYLGAKLFRHHCGRLLDGWIADGVMTAADAERLAHGIGAGNAARVYQLT